MENNERCIKGIGEIYKLLISELAEVKSLIVNSNGSSASNKNAESVGNLKAIDKEVFEVNSLNTFVKVKANSFAIEKVQFAFVEFDKNSKKLQKSMDYYMSIGDTLLLCNDILSGKISKLCQMEKAKGEKYPKASYESPLGGISEEKAKQRKLRSDGKAISRKFTIGAGSKAPFIITAEQRAGHTEGTGIIVPEGNPEVQIRVPVDNNTLKKFALTTKAHIEGYISAMYATNGYASSYGKGE